MNDAIKHTAGTVFAGSGFVGAITLSKVNEYGALICWVLGSLAALCTIHSWWKGQIKKRKKNHHE